MLPVLEAALGAGDPRAARPPGPPHRVSPAPEGEPA